MAKNAYGQEDPLCDLAYWNERSNTHQDAPISQSGEESGKLPRQTPRTRDAEMPTGRKVPESGNEY